MAHPIIQRLYEAITRRPYTSVRSAAAEFGPPPGARYADALAAYSDAELLAHGDEILAGIRRREAQLRRALDESRRETAR